METLNFHKHSIVERSEAARSVSMGSSPLTDLEALEEALGSPELLSSSELIAEALKDNFPRVNDKTLDGYRRHLDHFAQYLESAEKTDIYSAKRKHVARFLSHLTKKGGAKPHADRLYCSWCRGKGYPDGRNGKGWSPSQQKGALSAVRFLYNHFLLDEDLPDINPSQGVACPKQVLKRQWSPNKAELAKILRTQTKPRTRLLVHWMAYAPSRRETFINAKWEDIDFDEGTWTVVGKGNKLETYALNPKLIREFKVYWKWLKAEAQRNPLIADALQLKETAYVLLTEKGKRVCPSTVTRDIKNHGLAAGVGIEKKKISPEYPLGKTSKLTPHALRRAWARIALNDPQNPIPIDVVSKVLGHKSISTTRNHYAPTKTARANKALRDFDPLT